jgi:hypothetical protein
MGGGGVISAVNHVERLTNNQSANKPVIALFLSLSEPNKILLSTEEHINGSIQLKAGWKKMEVTVSDSYEIGTLTGLCEKLKKNKILDFCDLWLLRPSRFLK